jgi:ATP synthase protein I
VAIPTLVGIAFGLWIDRTWPSQYSWALMFLVAGVIVGCINAAYWVRKIRSRIIEED